MMSCLNKNMQPTAFQLVELLSCMKPIHGYENYVEHSEEVHPLLGDEDPRMLCQKLEQS
jgi:uncharacterized short protein YbdD (DUF466 family)